MAMVTKQNKTLKQFSEFITWLDNLKEPSVGEVWLKPIPNGTWSLREILTHILYWDKNSLEVMVPNMVDGAKVAFVDIEKHNQEAAAFAKSYTNFDVLMKDVVSTRQTLLEMLQEKYDDSIKLTIDNRNYTYKKFVNVFIHHDEHHIKQIEAFLEHERKANGQ
jgi:uncharacterized damage-inducible protein DinB